MALFSSNLSQALFVSVILSAGTIIVRAQWLMEKEKREN